MRSLLITLEQILAGPLQWWLVFIVIAFCFMCLETIWPAQRGHSVRGRLRNIAFSLIFMLFGSILVYATVSLTGGVSRQLRETHTLIWSIGSVFFTLFVGDFIYYWYHRAQHRFAPLWQLHELHHADEELNATTSRRTFFLEKPIQFLIIVLPSLLLIQTVPLLSFARMDSTAMSLYPYIAITWLVFTHANIRMPLGFFNIVITGPQYHRIHHSIETHHIDTNFAQFFPIFDKLFGTYYKPASGEYPATGTQHLASDASILTTQLRPFRQWLKPVSKTIAAIYR